MKKNCFFDTFLYLRYVKNLMDTMKKEFKVVKIEDLIKALQEAQTRGGKTVKYFGTVYVPETGNEIIISTEPQM